MINRPDRPSPKNADDTIRNLAGRLMAREADVKRLAAGLKAQAARIDKLDAAIRSIRDTTSWRITAPLRALSAGARRLFQGRPAQDRPTIPRRPTVAVCLIAKNEGRYLAEWLAYNILLGFDEILVYDNDSRDSTADIVKRASANDSRIRYVSWPDIPGQPPQAPAYNDALRATKADWIAFIDIDEFIVLKAHDTIGDFLAGFDRDTGAVCINWLVFGSSGHKAYADDLVIRRFSRCAAADFGVNRLVKSIVRRSAVKRMRVHAPELSSGHYRSSSGHIIALHPFGQGDPIVHYPAQINHYVLKSKEEYLAKKARGRGSRAPDAPDKAGKFTSQFWNRHDQNETVDTAILPMIPRVEEEIRRLMANHAR